MYLFLQQIWDGLAARITGPMSFRFTVQPLVAIVLGIRDGIKDAKVGNPPFFLDLVFSPRDRKRNIIDASKSIGITIIIGIVIDAIVQYLLFKQVRLVPAILVGTLVIAVPYSLARGLTNRIVSMRKKEKT